MNKIFTLALSAVMALTLAVQAPTQAHAGSKERALVAGLVVGAAAAALVYAKSKQANKKVRFSGRKAYANDECGPGYFMKRGKCQLRNSNGFKTAKFSGKKRKFASWQLQAIRKGCKPGLAWNKYEGCHEND